MGLIEKLVHQVFVDNDITYNTCWEDPRVDRKLLDIESDSKVVMITSAGCNALDYLLDDPARIYTLDINPAQNALLELKKALLKHGNHSLLKRFFGEGKLKTANKAYSHHLRERLPHFARTYWDIHIKDFLPKSNRRSFYDTGSSGVISRMFRRYIKHKDLFSNIETMIQAPTLERQKKQYEKIKSELWSPFSRWMLNSGSFMKLAGVTERQKERILQNDDGIYNYVADKMDHVFSNIDMRDNYFWYLYIYGRYNVPYNCPNYLLPENFKTLQNRINRIETRTQSIADFLKNNPGSYSQFILLDHQDWMDEEELSEEWTLILQNARPGAQILIRSVLPEVDFIPDFALNRIVFHPDRTDPLEKKDRVGTYGSLILATVN